MGPSKLSLWSGVSPFPRATVGQHLGLFLFWGEERVFLNFIFLLFKKKHIHNRNIVKNRSVEKTTIMFSTS